MKLKWNGAREPISVTGADISWGGALFTVSEPLPTETESALIALPWAHGNHIPISTSILRIDQPQSDQHLVAVRFSSLLPQDELRLRKLLTMLGDGSSTADGGDSNDLFHEIDLSVCDANEFLHTLSQIATGCYTLFVSGPYKLGQSVGLSIEGPNDLPALRLRARVVKVEQLGSDISAWTGAHSLTLKFEHPSASIESLVNSYLGGYLAKGRGTRRNASLPNVGNIKRFIATNVRCAIEVDYPEFLYRLSAIWGDASAFKTLFQDLTLGDIGQSGGLPLDVWEELNFLQMVHDQAYPLPTEVNLSSTKSVQDPRAKAPPVRGWIGRKLFGA